MVVIITINRNISIHRLNNVYILCKIESWVEMVVVHSGSGLALPNVLCNIVHICMYGMMKGSKIFEWMVAFVFIPSMACNALSAKFQQYLHPFGNYCKLSSQIISLTWQFHKMQWYGKHWIRYQLLHMWISISFYLCTITI